MSITLVAAAVSTAGVTLISLVFLLGGYLLVAALWYLMVYRPSRRDSSQRELGTGHVDDRPDRPT